MKKRRVCFMNWKMYQKSNINSLLNKDIFQIINYASGFTKTNISTNGNQITEENAQKLIQSGVTDIIVSIDGVSQAVYENYLFMGGIEDPNIYGGLPGSYPIGGDYCSYAISNWGVKFFADALLQRVVPISGQK